MRGCMVLCLVALSGCDLVFPPAKLSTDADSSHPDSDPLAADADLATPDGRAGDPDAGPDALPPPPDAGTCGLECLGDFSTSGHAPCNGGGADWCSTSALDSLDPYDVCSCSAGVPSLFFFDQDFSGMRMSVAFVPETVFQPFYLQVDGSGCLPPDVGCPLVGSCDTAGGILTYLGVDMTGGMQTFELFLDVDCSAGPFASFQWNP